MPFQPLTSILPNCHLPRGEIHFWLTALDQEASNLSLLSKTLSPDEAIRADRFHYEKDRMNFILCRGILRSILSNYLNTAPAGLRFKYGICGKPALTRTCGNDNIFFNLSHSAGLALYAFTREGEVGVDIEHVRGMPDMDHITECYFSAAEYAAYKSLPASRRPEGFFNCWTIKEAWAKALGFGLSLPLNKLGISFIPGETAQLLWSEGEVHKAREWSIGHLEIDPAFSAAYAIRQPAAHLRCFSWESSLFNRPFSFSALARGLPYKQAKHPSINA